jgi:hypothetical protein
VGVKASKEGLTSVLLTGCVSSSSSRRLLLLLLLLEGPVTP